MGTGVKRRISLVAATFEKANTYVFAERLIRNAEVRGSTPLCSTNNSHSFNNLAPHGQLGPTSHLAKTWPEKTAPNIKEPQAMATPVKRAVEVTPVSIYKSER